MVCLHCSPNLLHTALYIMPLCLTPAARRLPSNLTFSLLLQSLSHTLHRDPDVHKKFLKPSPLASELVDRCIECGFCESNCPSRDITLTPR